MKVSCFLILLAGLTLLPLHLQAEPSRRSTTPTVQPRPQIPAGTSSSHKGSLAVSPKNAWGDFEVVEKQEPDHWWVKVLLWIPNRILDLIDIFHVDVGVGASYGGVVRVSKWGQAGYRQMAPASVRFGTFGRSVPVKVERDKESGFGSSFNSSPEREVCSGEIGVGADAFLVGAYGGICVDELADFVGGLFFFDFKKDDIS
jgi:hypothetical protein